MKKIAMYVSLLMFLFLLAGCGKVKKEAEDITATIIPTAAPTASPTATPAPTQVPDNNQQNTAEELKIEDYFPMQADTEYVYEGSGNEYAAFNRVTDYLDAEKSRIQTRTNNGGTETVRVLEIKGGALTVIKTVNESYYRESFLEEAQADSDSQILLKEPLVPGTQWTLADGSKRSITSVDADVTTPSGSYKAIEVTTEGTDQTMKDYYAPQIGLVKSVFGTGDMEVSSSLSEIKTDTPYVRTIDIYYPDSDEKIYEEPINVTFHTNDDTKLVLQNTICSGSFKESYLPLASINTKINGLYLGDDNIVHADFSKELVSDMNAGSGYELLILQSITNTLGNYYGVQKVVITVDGKPYESGHVLMKEGESFQVDMNNVVR